MKFGPDLPNRLKSLLWKLRFSQEEHSFSQTWLIFLEYDWWTLQIYKGGCTPDFYIKVVSELESSQKLRDLCAYQDLWHKVAFTCPDQKKYAHSFGKANMERRHFLRVTVVRYQVRRLHTGLQIFPPSSCPGRVAVPRRQGYFWPGAVHPQCATRPSSWHQPGFIVSFLDLSLLTATPVHSALSHMGDTDDIESDQINFLK